MKRFYRAPFLLISLLFLHIQIHTKITVQEQTLLSQLARTIYLYTQKENHLRKLIRVVWNTLEEDKSEQLSPTKRSNATITPAILGQVITYACEYTEDRSVEFNEDSKTMDEWVEKYKEDCLRESEPFDGLCELLASKMKELHSRKKIISQEISHRLSNTFQGKQYHQAYKKRETLLKRRKKVNDLIAELKKNNSNVQAQKIQKKLQSLEEEMISLSRRIEQISKKLKQIEKKYKEPIKQEYAEELTKIKAELKKYNKEKDEIENRKNFFIREYRKENHIIRSELSERLRYLIENIKVSIDHEKSTAMVTLCTSLEAIT